MFPLFYCIFVGVFLHWVANNTYTVFGGSLVAFPAHSNHKTWTKLPPKFFFQVRRPQRNHSCKKWIFGTNFSRDPFFGHSQLDNLISVLYLEWLAGRRPWNQIRESWRMKTTLAYLSQNNHRRRYISAVDIILLVMWWNWDTSVSWIVTKWDTLW